MTQKADLPGLIQGQGKHIHQGRKKEEGGVLSSQEAPRGVTQVMLMGPSIP